MKFRFPIILKIALLGLLVSAIASSVALTISGINQNNRSKTTLINNIDMSLYSVDYSYTNGEDGANLVAQLKEVKDYVQNTIYNNPELHDAKLEDFASFEEYENTFQSFSQWIFPDGKMIIGSQPYFSFKAAYRELTHIISEAHLSSGAHAAYVAYREEVDGEKRLVFINDTRITNPDPKNEFYHLPGSHYVFTEKDEYIDKNDEDYFGYKINGYLTRLVPIYDTEGDKEEVACVFVEYDLKTISDTNLRIVLNELTILSIVMVVTVGLYMLIAHMTITRNLNKLTKATVSISNDLKEKKPIEPIVLQFKSHDEIATLADSFDVMELEIVNYINIIKQEAKENERREAELEVASSIQLNALPDKDYHDDNLNLAAFIKPAKTVGGDFYDYFYNKDEFIVIIADVSGKGIPAAMFMMKAKTLLKAKILSGLPLVDAVSEVNKELTANNESLLFVTAFIAAINFDKNEIHYVNAGHEKPYLIHQNKVIKLDGASNFVLGGEEDIVFIEEKAKFEKGDAFFTFTDGLNESINKDEEEFGYDRVIETLSESSGLSLNERIDLFNNKLKEFVGNEEQFDDITMITLSRNDGSYHLRYEQKDYSIIDDAINKFEEHFADVDDETRAHVGIALDELLNNLISYEKREDLIIELDFKKEKEGLKVVISCNGDDYDPFAKHKEKYLEHDDEEIAPGGFGVKLVKTLSKKYEYHYQDNHSYITLYF